MYKEPVTHLKKKWKALEDDAGQYKSVWQECGDWSQPSKSDITHVRQVGNDNPQRLTDAAIEACSKFASGMFANLFPPGTQWFKFKDVQENSPIAQWYERASKRVLEILNNSNFSTEAADAFLDIGSFGVAAIFVDNDGQNITFKNMTPCVNFLYSADHKGSPVSIGRKLKLTNEQIISKFGEDALKGTDLERILEEDERKKSERRTIIHLICKREKYDSNKKDNKNMPWASYHFDLEKCTLLSESGYEMFPAFVGRFAAPDDSGTYCTSPMMNVLATTRMMNKIERSVILGAEHRVNQQWLLPNDGSVKGGFGRPGGKIYYNAINPNGRPVRLESNSDVGLGVEMLERYEEKIKRAFFVDLFRTLEDRQNMTRAEVIERVQSDLTLLAPIVGRMMYEFITPLLTYVLNVLIETGQIEPPQTEEDIIDFKIDYVSRVALAVKNVEIQGAYGVIEAFTQISQLFPPAGMALDKINFDVLLDEAWYNASATMAALKDPELVNKERQAREEEAQMDKMAEQAPALADAEYKMAQIPA